MYKHLSREERYQIHSLLNAKQTISEIARLLGRQRSTISRGKGQRGYRAEQACRKASERAQHCRNARRVDAKVWDKVDFYLGVQWSPEQIASQRGWPLPKPGPYFVDSKFKTSKEDLGKLCKTHQLARCVHD